MQRVWVISRIFVMSADYSYTRFLVFEVCGLRVFPRACLALRRHENLVSADDVAASAAPALIVVLKNRERDFARSPLARRATEVTAIGRARLYRLL